MKRIVCLILALCLLVPLIAACGKDDDAQGDVTLKIGVLSGPTAIGALKMMKDGDARYNFADPYASPDLILSDVIAGNIDIAALPTNNAAALYNNGADIRVIALNTLGVLYVLDTTGTVNSLADLAGKRVYVPNAGSNPEYIVRHILAENNINATVDTSVVQPMEIRNRLLNGEIEIAVLPQPVATATVVAASSQSKTITTPIDLSTEWNKIEDTPIVQGCLVANADFCEEHPEAIEAFLEDYANSVEYMTTAENLDDAAALAVEYSIIAAAPIAKKAIPKCGIAYMDGKEMKTALDAFYTILHSYNPASIGGAIPDSDFYYED